jgi:DNA-binding response OmpR family regulator
MQKKVLIIEDDRDILCLLQYIFEEQHFLVFSSAEIMQIDKVKRLMPALI